MLGLILANQDKYPLDMVVNFDLEIEWEISKKVVSYIENKCKEANIKFVRIKPRKSWDELFSKNGFPTHPVKWCNPMYKLDCKNNLINGSQNKIVDLLRTLEFVPMKRNDLSMI